MGQKNFDVWKLNHTAATLAWNDGAIRVDVSKPDQGFELHRDHESVWGKLLAVEQISVSRGESLDPYARGTDLISRYPSSEDRRVGAELYWRWAAGGLAAAAKEADETNITDDEPTDQAPNTELAIGTVELIYSLETQFLDTEPDPEVHSTVRGRAIRYFAIDAGGHFQELPADQTKDATALLIEQADRRLLLATIPSDLKAWKVITSSSSDPNQTASSDTNEYQIKCHLNSDFLEKGVIRRMRLFAAFCEGAGDREQELLAAGIRFVNSEVPLTA